MRQECHVDTRFKRVNKGRYDDYLIPSNVSLDGRIGCIEG